MTDREIGGLVPRNLFGDIDPFRDLFASPFRLGRTVREPATGGAVGWTPLMDIVEDDDGYSVSLELAGANKDDITVECHESLLTIKGEKKSEREEKDDHRHYVERTYGSFSRSIRLPADASEEVRATFKDGVLTVVIPKAEERKARTIVVD